MEAKDFELLLKYSMGQSEKVLAAKREEYAADGVSTDRLQNFKRAGAMDNESPEKALWGMLKKHLISISDIITEIEAGKLPSHEKLFEKGIDVCNYIYLLEGLVCERIGLPPECFPKKPSFTETLKKRGRK